MQMTIKQLSVGLFLLVSWPVLAQDVINPQTNASQLTNGTLPATAMPALTGDCTTSAGAVATSCTKTGGVAFGAGATAATGQIPGTATNDNASAGNVGEFKNASAASGAVSLTSVTASNCVTLSLTAGDWAVSGNVLFVGAGTTTVTYAQSSISTSSVTQGSNTNTFYAAGIAYFGSVNGTGFAVAAPPIRVSLASTTNVFIEGFMNFGVSTATCGGQINAWRVR